MKWRGEWYGTQFMPENDDDVKLLKALEKRLSIEADEYYEEGLMLWQKVSTSELISPGIYGNYKTGRFFLEFRR